MHERGASKIERCLRLWAPAFDRSIEESERLPLLRELKTLREQLGLRTIFTCHWSRDGRRTSVTRNLIDDEIARIEGAA
jgi:hypothetical protein